MNNTTKTMAAACVAAFAAQFAWAVPVVSNVNMDQLSAKRVDITYSLSEAAVVTLEIQTNANTSASADDPGWTSIGGPAVCNAQGDVWKEVAAGSRTITWNPRQWWPDHVIANGGARAKVTAWALDNTPDYMAVDISAAAQPDTQTYYPAADFVPGGVTDGLYKTTKLLMRKIMAKGVEWTMGSTTLETKRNAREATHQVKLDGNYYIGVYEVTQAQWDLIQPSRLAPSYFNNAADRAMRPVEQVSYNEIRNSNNSTTADATYDWPADPNPNSFLGKLRTKTGIDDFDLPSEAQWEFAARAGNGDTKWGDGSGILNVDKDENLDLLGRYKCNGGQVQNGTSYDNPAASCGVANGTAIVGSYAPNAWGLYDMHGNVWEWCLDWSADDITAHGGKVNIDPTTPANTLSGASNVNRVPRGGCWYDAAGYCRPAFRGALKPSTRGNGGGFRLLCSAGLQ